MVRLQGAPQRLKQVEVIGAEAGAQRDLGIHRADQTGSLPDGLSGLCRGCRSAQPASDEVSVTGRICPPRRPRSSCWGTRNLDVVLAIQRRRCRTSSCKRVRCGRSRQGCFGIMGGGRSILEHLPTRAAPVSRRQSSAVSFRSPQSKIRRTGICPEENRLRRSALPQARKSQSYSRRG